MTIDFTDKNGRIVIISVDPEDSEIVMKLLAQIPNSEFIMRPVISYRR